MKKLILAFSVVVLILSSCSNSDNTSTEDLNTATPVLVKKMILTCGAEDDDTYWNSTIDFTYDGAKLRQSINEDNYKTTYSYTGNLITAINCYQGDTHVEQDLFTYNSNGKLVEYKIFYFTWNTQYKYVYTYNSNGTVGFNEYQGTLTNVGNTPITTGTYTFANGELSSNGSRNFTYDNKNNPFKNVIGYQELMLPDFADDYEVNFGRNFNILSSYSISNPSHKILSNYTYNSSNYPITASVVASTATMNGIVDVQYFY